MLSATAADQLVTQHLGATARATHSRFVAHLMRELAHVFNANAELWAVVGLCHDLDFFQTADNRSQHGILTIKWLGDFIPPEGQSAIASHDHRSGGDADTLLADALKIADLIAVVDAKLGREVLSHVDRNDRSLRSVDCSPTSRTCAIRWRNTQLGAQCRSDMCLISSRHLHCRRGNRTNVPGSSSEPRLIMTFDPEKVARALRQAWSPTSAQQWTAENPAAGQCNVTALLVFELFGGELLKTPLPEGDHFYNRIDGCRYDFTDSQFAQPITYSDLVATRAEAERGATETELTALRSAFQTHSNASVLAQLRLPQRGE